MGPKRSHDSLVSQPINSNFVLWSRFLCRIYIRTSFFIVNQTVFQDMAQKADSVEPYTILHYEMIAIDNNLS